MVVRAVLIDNRRLKVRFWSEADMNRKAKLAGSVESDPERRLAGRAHNEPRGSRIPCRGNDISRSLHAFANSAIVSFSNASAFFTLLR
jgi:hypothetical protein